MVVKRLPVALSFIGLIVVILISACGSEREKATPTPSTTWVSPDTSSPISRGDSSLPASRPTPVSCPSFDKSFSPIAAEERRVAIVMDNSTSAAEDSVRERMERLCGEISSVFLELESHNIPNLSVEFYQFEQQVNSSIYLVKVEDVSSSKQVCHSIFSKKVKTTGMQAFEYLYNAMREGELQQVSAVFYLTDGLYKKFDETDEQFPENNIEIYKDSEALSRLFVIALWDRDGFWESIRDNEKHFGVTLCESNNEECNFNAIYSHEIENFLKQHLSIPNSTNILYKDDDRVILTASSQLINEDDRLLYRLKEKICSPYEPSYCLFSIYTKLNLQIEINTSMLPRGNTFWCQIDYYPSIAIRINDQSVSLQYPLQEVLLRLKRFGLDISESEMLDNWFVKINSDEEPLCLEIDKDREVLRKEFLGNLIIESAWRQIAQTGSVCAPFQIGWYIAGEEVVSQEIPPFKTQDYCQPFQIALDGSLNISEKREMNNTTVVLEFNLQGECLKFIQNWPKEKYNTDIIISNGKGTPLLDDMIAVPRSRQCRIEEGAVILLEPEFTIINSLFTIQATCKGFVLGNFEEGYPDLQIMFSADDDNLVNFSDLKCTQKRDSNKQFEQDSSNSVSYSCSSNY